MRLFFIVVLLGFFNNTYSQEKDIWSGKYIIKSSESITIDSIKIEKIADLQKDDVAARFESDLKRWKITSKSDNYEDESIVRRFIYNPEDEENEYEEFGWTKLYLKKEMKCMDAGHFFMCQTKPNNTIKIDGESFTTKTGFFGIRLHYGLFELEKYN